MAAPTRRDLTAIAHRAMIQRGLIPEFAPAVLEEVRTLVAQPAPLIAGVRDHTDRLWMSVDNESSRDLDQLSVAEPLDERFTRLFVALADVDALVRADSAMDRHARTNTTSVYTAAGIFSMLPERLSTDLTSLNQGHERLALVVQMDIDADGSVDASEIFRARVINRARLNYDEVAAWLDGTAGAPRAVGAVAGMDAQVRLQDRIGRALKQHRQERGALSLDTPKTTVVFDGDTLTGLQRDARNRAKDMIEDFMIAVNTATARFLEDRGYPSIRRVLRAPARWDRIVTIARQLGEPLPASPDAPALERFLLRRRTAAPGSFGDLSLAVVKLLGSGEYAVEGPGDDGGGHFGLAIKDYAHSTAPNRRYADLITHRLLKAAMTGAAAPYATDTLGALARQCTQQGNNANKVERQVRKSAAALLLASRVGEQFDAIVTGASEKGTWVRLLAPPVEGRVVTAFDGFDVGDRVRVELVATDVEQGFIDFHGRGAAQPWNERSAESHRESQA
jgi:ribonuclease R